MQITTEPQNPIAAVTHPNPYPYYADLVLHKPCYFDETLRCWVASSASAVQAVLSSDLCRVRPPAEPVPKALLESPAAAIFQHLIRQNDGDRHQPYKRAVVATLGSVSAHQVKTYASKWAQVLISERYPQPHVNDLSEFSFQLPVYVVGNLLGIPDHRLPHTFAWIRDFAACLSPMATEAQIEQGKLAAGNLLNLFHGLVRADGGVDGLLGELAHQAEIVGRTGEALLVANAIGFLVQAYEATAGLTGAAVIALAACEDLYRQIKTNAALLPAFVREVVRCDASVQNTRRFLAEDGVIAGQHMQAGAAVLVVLAAANYDPAANPQPQDFDMFRTNRQTFTFGLGAHACAGEQLAVAITTAAVEQLMASGFTFDLSGVEVRYRPSANTRVPLFLSL